MRPTGIALKPVDDFPAAAIDGPLVQGLLEQAILDVIALHETVRQLRGREPRDPEPPPRERCRQRLLKKQFVSAGHPDPMAFGVDRVADRLISGRSLVAFHLIGRNRERRRVRGGQISPAPAGARSDDRRCLYEARLQLIRGHPRWLNWGMHDAIMHDYPLPPVYKLVV